MELVYDLVILFCDQQFIWTLLQLMAYNVYETSLLGFFFGLICYEQTISTVLSKESSVCHISHRSSVTDVTNARLFGLICDQQSLSIETVMRMPD